MMMLKSYKYIAHSIQIANQKIFCPVLGPCADVICTNNTDTCKYGICQCGNVRGFTCDMSSELPQCFSGSCGCSKKAGSFEIGDGTTQGSCLSDNHRCQSSGRCLECISDSQCFGLSDKCRNNRCVCGDGPACNPTKSSQCIGGVCKCGTNSECASLESVETLASCSSSSCYYDYTTTTCLMQRSSDEICELITDKYNPIYIPNNAIGADVICDDNHGKFQGTYQCLGEYLQHSSFFI